MNKANKGRKISVITDELKITGGGLYCFLPFERIDKNKKAIFKIGLATKSLAHRLENYHTYFPLGVYMVAFLQAPPIPRALRNKEETPTKTHYLKIEKSILDYIDTHGGKRIYSSTRVRNPNDSGEGQTEWVYASEDIIHEAFSEAHKKYSENLRLFYLEGLNPETGKFETINDIAKVHESQKSIYTGKIIFHI